MRVFGTSMILVLSCAVMWSQARSVSEAGSGRWEIYGGLALTGPNPSNARSGGGGGICAYPLRWLGINGDFTVVRGSGGAANTTTLTDFLVGPRLGKPMSTSLRVSPFADFLIGFQHMSNSSSQHSYYYTTGSGSAQAVDGGIDIGLASRLVFRAQVGAVFSHFAVAAGSTNGATNIRWRTGAYLGYRF